MTVEGGTRRALPWGGGLVSPPPVQSTWGCAQVRGHWGTAQPPRSQTPPASRRDPNPDPQNPNPPSPLPTRAEFGGPQPCAAPPQPPAITWAPPSVTCGRRARLHGRERSGRLARAPRAAPSPPRPPGVITGRGAGAGPARGEPGGGGASRGDLRGRCRYSRPLPHSLEWFRPAQPPPPRAGDPWKSHGGGSAPHPGVVLGVTLSLMRGGCWTPVNAARSCPAPHPGGVLGSPLSPLAGTPSPPCTNRTLTPFPGGLSSGGHRGRVAAGCVPLAVPAVASPAGRCG